MLNFITFILQAWLALHVKLQLTHLKYFDLCMIYEDS